MRIALTLVICCVMLSVKAQTHTELLRQVKTIEQAETFVEKHKRKEARIFSISANKDTADILMPLYSRKAGHTFSFENYTYKIITTDSHPEFRVHYIYLDGSQLTSEQIDSLRKTIIAKYKSGTPFIDLVSEYTMDGNILGITPWFQEGMMMKDFETAVRKRRKNDIFTVDVPENKWYYVVLKSFDDRIIHDLQLLKVRTQ